MAKTKLKKLIKPRRLVIWQLALLVVWSWLFFRLLDLQVFQQEKWRRIARDNQYFSWQIPAERGVFVDRYQDSLTFNVKQYYQLADEVALFSARTPIDRSTAMAVMATQSAAIVYDYYRQYPWGEATAHTLGFVGKPSRDDLQKQLGTGPESWLGRSGLERWFEERLRGVSGWLEVELSARGERRQLLQELAAVPGALILTSLDPYLSKVALVLLNNRPGAVIIEDAQTGQILSLVSSPAFNPNLLTKPSNLLSDQDKSIVSGLFTSLAKPEFNRAIAGTYPPGSIFKLVTALAGLEAGVIDAQTSVTDEGVLKVGDYSYANWYYTQYGRTEGPIALIRALARSNDIYFYKVAEWTGPEKLAEMARLLGMGRASGLEIGLEAPGLMPNPSWKEQNVGEKWFLGNTYHMGIGQSDILVTPLQMAQLTQTVFNAGQLCAPSLLAPADPSRCQNLSINPDHLALVQRGMIEACSPGGTAFPFFDYNQRWTNEKFSQPKEAIDAGMVACKTGTAEFGGVNEQGFRRTHAWFTLVVGINKERIQASKHTNTAPELSQQEQILAELYRNWRLKEATNPLPKRLVITVLVESNDDQPHPEGSSEAGPVARSIVNWIYTGRL